MQEIKFRGKRLDTGEWMYGHYVKFDDCLSVIFKPEEPIEDMYYKRVITETVGQFTGVKDNGGREIYKGDIVRLKQWNPQIYQVFFANGGFCFGKSETDAYYNDIHYAADGEVIGNIYENPELLA